MKSGREQGIREYRYRSNGTGKPGVVGDSEQQRGTGGGEKGNMRMLETQILMEHMNLKKELKCKVIFFVN